MEPQKIETLVSFLQAAGQRKRLHILGILAEREATATELARRIGIKQTAVLKHLTRLENAALVVETNPYTYQLNQAALEQLNYSIFHRGDSQNQETTRQRVLRHYTNGRRLKQLPENDAELQEIAGWLADFFEDNVSYPEATVNERLRQAHPDYATLRRVLVDLGFMTRSRGVYQKVESLA